MTSIRSVFRSAIAVSDSCSSGICVFLSVLEVFVTLTPPRRVFCLPPQTLVELPLLFEELLEMSHLLNQSLVLGQQLTVLGLELHHPDFKLIDVTGELSNSFG